MTTMKCIVAEVKIGMCDRWVCSYFFFRYEKVVNGERGFGDFSKSTVFNARWSHRQDIKSSPYSNFSASVNIGSSDYFRESINQLNNPLINYLSN